jgi:adenylyltransferase/sulfurtransferase
VLGPVAAVVASLQAIAAIKMMSGNVEQVRPELWSVDLWAGRSRSTPVERQADCPTCGRGEFTFLSRSAGQTTTLCGRHSVQVRPAGGEVRLDLLAAAQKLAGIGEVIRTPYLVRCRIRQGTPVELTVFADGRLIVTGTTDPDSARSLYARYVGT